MFRLIVCISLCATAAAGYSSGPPDGKTGRPGEGTCADCHSFSGSGDSTFLSGLPVGGYKPESTYALTLTVNYSGQRRWGFEITATDQSQTQAGQFVVSDSVHTRLSSSGGRQYVKQTTAGTFANQTSATWQFGWRAPAASVGPVTFYWCANAANNNGSAAGDYSLTASLTIPEAGIEEEPTPRRQLWHYSSPGRNRVVIHYRGIPEQPVRIWSAEGRLVRTLRPTTDGEALRLDWDGHDEAGRLVPEAGYFIRLGSEVSEVVRVQLVR
uniref:Uncharacterized protein n=1 Tax=candidate division WOR-3 bacterium TaxID=2052148 RepID=A0A7C4CEG1_UNCW3